MKPEMILEDAELRRRRGLVAIILVFVMALVMLYTGLSIGQKDVEVTQRWYMSALAEKDAEIEAITAEKEAEIEAKSKEIWTLKQRAATLDENGVRVDRMAEIYTESDPYRESEIQTDAEFREHCRENYPEAVLSEDGWTTEEIIRSWRENPEIWGLWEDSYNGLRTYFTWTADYEHCYYLDIDEPILITDYETGEHRELVSGWLVMDGVRVEMIDAKTYEVNDPYEMLRQYQTGEWDGVTRRSHDGSTTVEVDGLHGRLEYHYQAWRYDATLDPLGVGYTGFNEEPWWLGDDLTPELLTAVGEGNRYDVWNDTRTRAYDWLWTWDFYVDLPEGVSAGVDGLGTVYNTRKTARGTFFVTSTGVWLYDKGELVDGWRRDLSDKAELYMRCVGPKTAEEIADLSTVIPEGSTMSERERAQKYADDYTACQEIGLVAAEDLVYVYTDGELLVLKTGGEIEPFFDRLVKAPGSMRASIWGLRDGRLIYWNGYVLSNSDLPEVVAEDVIETDFADLALFTKEDGCYGVVRVDGRYEAQYLGSEAMDYYRQAYQTLRAAVMY